MQRFQHDCIALALQRHRRGRISRRSLLQALAALGALGPLGGTEALAQAEQQLVMVKWGGLANEGFGKF